MKKNLSQMRYKVLKILDLIAGNMKTIKNAKDMKVVKRAIKRMEINYSKLWSMMSEISRRNDK